MVAFFKKFFVIIAMFLSLSGILALTPINYASAASSCETSFLGMPSWHRGLAKNASDCSIISPGSIEDGKFIWTIVINVVEAATILAAYVSFGFILYGGFRYLTSAGSAKNIEEAKTSISNAVIGLVLSIVATSVVDFIFATVIGGADIKTLSAETVLSNTLDKVYLLIGVISVIMIIYGGFTYISSAGDSKKIETAKNTITYSVVGLIVAILAKTITWFVISIF